MALVGSLAGAPRGRQGPAYAYPIYARFAASFHLFLDLLAPALVLGLLRTAATELAPRYDMYFTAEAALIAYAYFAVMRCAYVGVHGRDAAGRYDRNLARKASSEFHRGLGPYAARIAVLILGLLLAAFVLDLLTRDSGLQHRPNVHLAILLIEIMIWARYGAAIVTASAHWRPNEPLAFSRARDLAGGIEAARSFVLTNLAFGAIAIAALAPFKLGAISIFTRSDALVWSTLLFTAIALIALWMQRRWATVVAVRLQVAPPRGALAQTEHRLAA